MQTRTNTRRISKIILFLKMLGLMPVEYLSYQAKISIFKNVRPYASRISKQCRIMYIGHNDIPSSEESTPTINLCRISNKVLIYHNRRDNKMLSFEKTTKNCLIIF